MMMIEAKTATPMKDLISIAVGLEFVEIFLLLLCWLGCSELL